MEHPFLERRPLFSTMPPARLAALNIFVAFAYAISGYGGLTLAFVAHAVTLFWPPSGLAFAAVWLGGLRLLPGVFLGAFIVNILALHNPGLVAVIAAGNMLPALLATLALRWMIAREPQEGELRRLLMFIAIAVLGCTMASATVGTLAVSTIGHVTTPVATTWLIWWMGDAMGVMIVAPPVLLWRRLLAGSLALRNLFEIAGFALAGLGVIAALLVIDKPIWAVELGKLCTLLLSLLAGARFGLNGPAWMTLLMAVSTVGMTARGAGPFLRGDFYDSFAFVHSYLFAESVAGMLLAGALTDLRETIRREKLARADAEAAAANRIRLLAMISHDVRTPLAGIMSVFQTLTRTSPTPEQEQVIGLGLRAGTALTALVGDLLDVARADLGRIVLDVAPFDPAQSLSDIVEMNRNAAAAKYLRLDLICATPLPALLLGDRIRLEQIVGNLVSNAVIYTAHGGVSVTASWYAERGHPLEITVTDSGPGMPPAFVPGRIDELALPLEPTQMSGGLGLGLHICKRLVELMGGVLDYTRVSGGGSCFSVALPLRVAAQTSAAPLQTAGAALRILLVEDDDIAREATCALLKSYLHDVVAASDAISACALVEQKMFDVILLDMQLSPAGSSGLDVARHVRALPAPASATKILALTGDGLEKHHAAYRAAGIDGLVLKPLVITSDLSATLRSAVWRR